MSDLTDALAVLAQDRAAFAAEYDALTPAPRSFRPPDGGWTADEVLQHVVKAETGTLHVVSKQAAAGEARRGVGTPDGARFAAVEAFMRSDRRTTMPAAAVGFIAPTSPPDAGWRERLGAFDDAWDRLAETMPADLHDVALMDHPASGPLTAAGAARFTAGHLDHHRRQLARLRTAAGFPEA
jgi:hypothetical protein